MVEFKIVEEVGVVKGINGSLATVSVPKKSSCEGCTLKTCRPADQFMEIEALNPVAARIGQKVRITMKPHTYLRGSIIVYGIPAASLIAGAVVGKELLSSFFPGLDPDTVSALSGVGAFAASFLLIKAWSRRDFGRSDCTPVIEEILNDQTG